MTWSMAETVRAEFTFPPSVEALHCEAQLKEKQHVLRHALMQRYTDTREGRAALKVRLQALNNAVKFTKGMVDKNGFVAATDLSQIRARAMENVIRAFRPADGL